MKLLSTASVLLACGLSAASCKEAPPTQSDPASASAKPGAAAEKRAPSDRAPSKAATNQPTVAKSGGVTPKDDNSKAGSDKPPTSDEWNSQVKEVTVRGSSALNCETKMVRSWLRVSCRGRNKSGGVPKSVKVTKGGGHGKDFTFVGSEVTSLVVKWRQGVDLEAVFAWSDKRAKLHVYWPHTAPEPGPKGIFSAL